MKRKILLIAVLALILLPAHALDPVAKGKTNHELGDFTVEKSSAPIIIDATLLPTYEVSYENSDLTIRIAVDKTDKKCMKFIVVSNNLAMQYNCTGKFFGVSMPDQCYIEDGIPASTVNLDRSEYHRQRVITKIKKSELEHVRLISVYFPMLVKNYDTYFAVK